MKVGIFNPYLDSLGGGERYSMTVAECLAENGCEVDVFWNDKLLKEKLESRLHLSLKRVNFVEDIFYSKGNLIRRWKETKKYDLIFYVSDGSLPFLFAKKNVLHFQVPFHGVNGKTVLNKLKLARFSHIICNSFFTKKEIDKEYGVESEVIYPPVAVGDFKPGKKENLILSVGRFTRVKPQSGVRLLHSKKQEILASVFKQMIEEDSSGLLSGWKLILIGGALDEDRGYIKELEKIAKGWPVEILTNVDFSTLQRLYGKAKIFWHATGFEEDENNHPERMEHFGIAVVEAMVAGCVPVVIGKGGIPEIITDGKNGFLWQTKEELVRLTLKLIKSSGQMKKIAAQAIKDSQRFSKEVFCEKINDLVGG